MQQSGLGETTGLRRIDIQTLLAAAGLRRQAMQAFALNVRAQVNKTCGRRQAPGDGGFTAAGETAHKDQAHRPGLTVTMGLGQIGLAMLLVRRCVIAGLARLDGMDLGPYH